MWRMSKQVERTACDRLPADSGTVLQYRDELSEIGPVLTKLASRGRWCGHAQRAALRPAAVGVTDRHRGGPQDCNPGVGAAGGSRGDVGEEGAGRGDCRGFARGRHDEHLREVPAVGKAGRARACGAFCAAGGVVQA